MKSVFIRGASPYGGVFEEFRLRVWKFAGLFSNNDKSNTIKFRYCNGKFSSDSPDSFDFRTQKEDLFIRPNIHRVIFATGDPLLFIEVFEGGYHHGPSRSKVISARLHVGSAIRMSEHEIRFATHEQIVELASVLYIDLQKMVRKEDGSLFYKQNTVQREVVICGNEYSGRKICPQKYRESVVESFLGLLYAFAEKNKPLPQKIKLKL